ncbi:MAG: hypothetical protein B7X57_06265 [Erythrobacter sp. 34-65-8]|nr:MAG: hypothetical protein B7X57_06265 [Erythrobacter sp. 34-65-8]
MTSIDQFVAFARALPLDRRAPVEEALGAIMATYAADCAFADSEMAEIDRRLAEQNPEYSPANEITGLLGKPFA